MTVIRKISLQEICLPIEPELGEFSAVLKRELASTDGLIQGIHSHMLKMSGKFLRPVLALLSSKTENGASSAGVIRLAVAAELIHMATLIHDDIIDGSDFRRNQPSVHFKWGREISIVSGDYLYAKAFMILSNFDDPKIGRTFAACAHVMCEGEMKQIEKRKDFNMPEEEYLRIIHKKTAALFQAACMGGATLAGNAPASVEKLGRFGYGLGMAFQIVDDCMDLAVEDGALGKKAGLDLLKSDVTLPILYLFSDLDRLRKDALLDKMRDPNADLLGEFRALVLDTGALSRAMDRARIFAQDALEAVKGLPASPCRDSLVQLVDYCLDRAH
jgi:geranylgeranyl pyrophosphate synthase